MPLNTYDIEKYVSTEKTKYYSQRDEKELCQLMNDYFEMEWKGHKITVVNITGVNDSNVDYVTVWFQNIKLANPDADVEY